MQKPAVPLKDALYSKIVNSGRMKLVEEAQSGYLVEENSLKVRPGSGVPVVIRNKELPPQPGQETPITAQLAAAHEPPAETPVLPAEIQSGQVEQGESGSDIRSEISSFSGFMDKSLQSISSEIKPHLKSDLPAVPPPTQTDAVPPATQPVSSSPPLENIQHESAELSKPEENFTNNPVYLPMQVRYQFNSYSISLLQIWSDLLVLKGVRLLFRRTRSLAQGWRLLCVLNRDLYILCSNKCRLFTQTRDRCIPFSIRCRFSTQTRDQFIQCNSKGHL